MIVKIIYSILFLGFGFVLLKYRKTVKSWTGNFFWAEKYLGRGGTYLVIILLGMLSIFMGIIYPFGGLDLLLGKQ